jgi:hypothetical protein
VAIGQGDSGRIWLDALSDAGAQNQPTVARGVHRIQLLNGTQELGSFVIDRVIDVPID